MTFRVHVPITENPRTFSDRVSELLVGLRVRWANVGYTYALWGPDTSRPAWEARAEHATRHPGFDIDEWIGSSSGPFYETVRSVSWWTVLGAALEEGWRSAGGAWDGLERIGPHALCRAAPVPLRGDRDAGDLVETYRAIDVQLRAVRCPAFTTPTWWGSWDMHQITRWLSRFETDAS